MMSFREFIVLCELAYRGESEHAGYTPVEYGGETSEERSAISALYVGGFLRNEDAREVCRKLGTAELWTGPWCRLTRPGLDELMCREVPGLDFEKILQSIIAAEAVKI